MDPFSFIIDQFIGKGIAEGLSANAIQTALSAAGLGIRRTDLLARVRELSNVPQQASVLKYLPNGARPSQANITKGGSFQNKPYLSTVELKLYNEDTGEYFTYYRNISSNDLMTAGELKQAASDVLNERLATSNISLQSSYVTSVFARSDIYNG